MLPARMDPLHMLLAALIGLIAGLLGGLAGIGGSMIMIPGLGLLFGFTSPDKAEQHTYMAAAMAVNVVVSIPATLRHARAGAVRKDLVRFILPAMIVAIVVGVLVSNVMSGALLKYGLAGFIAFYCIMNLIRAARPTQTEHEGPERAEPATLIGIGAAGGFAGGLLGLGGGVVLVPLLQLLARVKLRHAIATSSATMVLSATIGAALKFATLEGHQQSAWRAAALALAMSPGAVLGAHLGASLTHTLPIRTVRVLISVLLLIAAVRLAGVDAWLLALLR